MSEDNVQEVEVDTRFTMEYANEIKETILDYAERYIPNAIDNVFIIGSISEKGYSNNDIDLVITWATDKYSKLFMNFMKEHISRISSFLEKKGFPVDKIDLFSYMRCLIYNKPSYFYHPFFTSVSKDESMMELTKGADEKLKTVLQGIAKNIILLSKERAKEKGHKKITKKVIEEVVKP